MNELFPAAAVASKSPRLQWLEKHDIHVSLGDMAYDSGGDEIGQWCAFVRDFNYALDRTPHDSSSSKYLAFGFTESEAIVTISKNRGIRLWNEEALAVK